MASVEYTDQFQRMSTNQVEFMAENELILIRPNFEIKENKGYMNCISGDFGPFNPLMNVSVPLWLALALKKMAKCRILQPAWLSVQFLSAKLSKEKEGDAFEQMPYHYMELASLVFQHAPDDMEDLVKIRTLMEDIQNVRQDKIRNGLQRIASDVQSGGTASAVKMNNVGALEINSVRDFMVESLDKFYQLSAQNSEEFGASSSTQEQPPSSTSPVSPPKMQRLRRHR